MHGLHSVTASFLAEGQSISIDCVPKAFVECETEFLAVMKTSSFFVMSMNVSYEFPPTQPPSLALFRDSLQPGRVFFKAFQNFLN